MGMARREQADGIEKRFYRPRDVARVVGVSLETVYAAIRVGDLKASNFGQRSLVVTPEDLDIWIESSLTPVVAIDTK